MGRAAKDSASGPYAVPLRWTDFDRYGHVNNAAFITLLEIVREQFLVEHLGSVPHFVIARIEVDFRCEIRDELRAWTDSSAPTGWAPPASCCGRASLFPEVQSRPRR
jgi:hypothetical protein